MGVIATELEAYYFGEIFVSDINNNRCCTYDRALKFGCIVNGSYASNQLVQLEDIRGNAIDFPYNISNLSISSGRDMTILIDEYTQVCYGVRYHDTNYWQGLADITYESTTYSNRKWSLDSSLVAYIYPDIISYEWIVGVSASIDTTQNGILMISAELGVSLTNSNPTSYLLASDVSSSDTIYIFDYYND